MPDLRPTAHARGYGAAWQRARLAFLSAYPLCVECEAAGRLVEATDVDHKVPHRGDQRLFWDRDNWQPLCHACHARKTATEDGAFGRPVTNTTLVRVVAGPPASGKTTWVRERAAPGDIILDLDTIAAALTGLPPHECPAPVLPFACAARDAVVARLARPSDVRFAFVITADPSPYRVNILVSQLRAILVIMPTTEADCLARAATDPERRTSADRWSPLIRSWFEAWGTAHTTPTEAATVP